MTFRCSLLSAASACVLLGSGIAAHADTITTFTLTHGTDTISFSISDSTPVTPAPFTFPVAGENYDYHVPLTIDGTVYQPGPDSFASEFVGPDIHSTGGAQFGVQYTTGYDPFQGYTYVDYFEQQGPAPYAVVNGLPVYSSETIVYPVSYYEAGPIDVKTSGDTLVITQSVGGASPVPEPSTLGLLGTGFVGLVGIARRRLR